MTFRDLNLNSSLLKALDELGLETPTGIQEKSFSVIMSGRDMIGIAQTGTGKTFAYLLPSLRQWKFAKDRFPQILIIVPTRELVVQVVEEIKKLTPNTNFVAVPAYGGTNINTQAFAVEQGADAIVATPGRLLDLCLRGSLNLKAIKKFVVDEFDEMLNLGFLPQIKRVIEFLPDKRQNLLFSATMTEDVEEVIDEYFNDPIRIEAAPVGTPLENIEQVAYHVRNFNTKVNLLNHLLSTREDMTKVLVFASTKKFADELATRLEEKYGEITGVIHSNKSQNYRFNSVNRFVSGEYRLLIATDIVARGIDVSAVSHVINFDIPESPENYIHRIGRTGRADKKGDALSFITEKEIASITAIQELMKFEIPVLPFPEEVEISEVLIEEELPKYKMKNIVVRAPKEFEGGGAFHEKKDKNKKVNVVVRHSEKMKLKYGKPKTRGQKGRKK